jgi:hypothetical protein
MNNPNNISENLETIFWVKNLKFFDADPGSGMEKIRIRDVKKFGSGKEKIRIREKHPKSATMKKKAAKLRTRKATGENGEKLLRNRLDIALRGMTLNIIF